MLFEDKALDQIASDDIKALIQSARRENLTLEYKEAYEQSDRGKREFLLDVCQFANSAGGDLLIGVPEFRDADGHATGLPDPEGALGINVTNPEQLLTGYENQILDSIDERLPVKLKAIACGSGHVLVVRVPNSLAKPHRVHYQKHIYFPARRERRRYELNAREIKELAMRTASQTEKAESHVQAALTIYARQEDEPVFVAAVMPVFSANFSVDLQNSALRHRLATLDLRGGSKSPDTVTYTVAGLTKAISRNTSLSFGHNGLLRLHILVPSTLDQMRGGVRFYPVVLDIYLRGLVLGAGELFNSAGLGAPAVLGASLYSRHSYLPAYSDWNTGPAYPPQLFHFPLLPLNNLGQAAEQQIRPLCDHIHQGFGNAGSPAFDHEGKWIQTAL